MATDPEFEKVYRAAQESFDDHRFDEAERLFLKLLDRNTRGYADVFNRLGLISVQKGQYELAAKYFEKALALNPKYTDASLNLVVTYNELRNFTEAERIFTQAAKVVRSEPASLDPFIQGKLANEHGKLGDAYYDLGRYDQALDEYQKAVALRPNFVDILTKIGTTLREKGDLDQAVGAFTKAKKSGPKYVPAYIHLGITYYAQGRRDLAIQEWKTAQKIDPANRAVQTYLNLAKKP
ncbi:MAG: tetratricopeptide repeat protein [Nitrospirae bacterium]|nr:tetratricopeptide repeat protein [Nitrospirota bacterium]